MGTVLMDQYVKNIYDLAISKITDINNSFERGFFSINYYRIPNGDLLDGKSFDDNISELKDYVARCDSKSLDMVFELLRDFYFFSAGNDMVFRKKLEADSYRSVPIEKITLPFALQELHEKFEDDSKFEASKHSRMHYVKKAINNSINISTFLYYLYCNDFIPEKNMENKFPVSYTSTIRILNKHSITIGDYLKALTDYKCSIMKDVFKKVKDICDRETMFSKIDDLKKEKYDEINHSYYCNLHICYFFNHTVTEYIRSLGDISNNYVCIKK